MIITLPSQLRIEYVWTNAYAVVTKRGYFVYVGSETKAINWRAVNKWKFWKYIFK